MHVFKLLPVLALGTLIVLSAHAQAGVKSYKEWKSDRIQVVQTKVATIRNQIGDRKNVRAAYAAQRGQDPNLAKKGTLEAASTSDYTVEKLERQLRAEQYNLEMAHDLSVTDYFVGYLTKVQDKKSAFSEVAGKLTPEEVAELMNAYANSVFGSQAGDLPSSAANIEKTSGK